MHRHGMHFSCDVSYDLWIVHLERAEAASHSANKAKPERSPAFFLLSWNHRKGKVPSISISKAGKRSILLEGALPVLKIQHMKKMGGKCKAQRLKTDEVKIMDKEAKKQQRTQQLALIWSCTQDIYGMTFLGRAHQCKHFLIFLLQLCQNKLNTYLKITAVLRNILSVMYSTSDYASCSWHRNTCTTNTSAVQIVPVLCMPTWTSCKKMLRATILISFTRTEPMLCGTSWL